MFEEENYDNNIVIDKEFETAQYCTIFELTAILKDKQNKLYKTSSNMNYIFNQNLQYAERFNKYGVSDDLDKMAQKAVSIRKLVSVAKMKAHEEALIINLLPLDAEEAFNLIPSLQESMSKEELQYYLNELVKLSKNN